MSRGFHRDDNDRVGKSDTQNRMSLSQSRTGGGGEIKNDRADRPQGNYSARSEQQPLTHEREQTRYGRNRHEWSPPECAVICEVGRFRTLDEQDVERVFYRANPKQFLADLDKLSKQGLLLRRLVSGGKKGEMRHFVVLSKRATRPAQHHRLAPIGQAVHAGFVKPAEVSHDASIYKMYEAEAVGIEAAGGRVHRVVLDFEFKDLAKRNELPVLDGKISLPDLRTEYKTAEGDRAYIDLELVTENYRPGHRAKNYIPDFKIYGMNSTSRGRRAEWEGRELSAEVLAL